MITIVAMREKNSGILNHYDNSQESKIQQLKSVWTQIKTKIGGEHLLCIRYTIKKFFSCILSR